MGTTSFKEMKKNVNTVDALKAQIDKLNTTSTSSADDRYWYPKQDKAGNGYAVIRFLPAANGEDSPFVRLFNKGFKGPTGKWYIENCRTTIGEDDPVVEYATKLWDAGNEDGARKIKRKLNYVSNIYVITDPATPENEGKVFLYKYGSKVYEKIQAMLNTQFPGETPIDVFNFWEGCNFKIKLRKVEGYNNFDLCSFEAQAPLSNDDDKLEAIWKSQYSLNDLIAPSNFLPYDVLKAKFEAVMFPKGGNTSTANENMATDDSLDQEVLKKELASTKKPPVTKKPVVEEDDEFNADYFKSIAEDDAPF